MRIRQVIVTSLFILAVIAGVVIGRWVGPGELPDRMEVSPSSKEQHPALYVAEQDRDLGELWESADAKIPVRISNSTDKPIEILGFEKSCDCITVEPQTLVVPPNGNATAMVKINLTQRLQNEIGLSARDKFVRIQPRISVDDNRVDLAVRFRVKSALTINYSRIQFGTITPDELMTRVFLIKQHTQLSEIKASVDFSAFDAAIFYRQGGAIEMRLMMCDPCFSGAIESVIRITWRHAELPVQGELCIPFNAVLK